MPSWDREFLERIVESDDLHVSPYRADGVTYGTPTWIWCVAVDGELYVRAFNGRASRWYQSAIEQGAGRITVASAQIDVTFTAAPAEINDQVDAAYAQKYRGSQYLPPMVTEKTRAATVKITPTREHTR